MVFRLSLNYSKFSRVSGTLYGISSDVNKSCSLKGLDYSSNFQVFKSLLQVR